MKVNKWTVGLAAAGLVSLPCLMQAEEKAANTVMTALSSTTISGYVDTSAHWNPGTGNANPAPYLYNAGKADGFNLNKVKVSIAKPITEENWSTGYRADLLFGPDANVFGTTSTGINVSDFAIQQAYVTLGTPALRNGLDFKLGVFDSIIGYESHDSVNDPNYTRSYATSFEPHTHTGLLATYRFFDWLGVAAGIANTMRPTINEKPWMHGRAESEKTYMGSFEINAPDAWGFLAGSKFFAGVVDGFGSAEEDQSNWYVGATLNTPTKALKLGASFDYAHGISTSGRASITAGGANVNLSAFSQRFDTARSYALYASLQPEGTKWGFHLRGEYAEAFPLIGGSTTALIGGTPVQLSSVTPTKVDVFALTGTISYDLWKNVLSRLEVRWDHAADGTHGGRIFGGQTTGEPTRKNEYLIAANVIYKF